MEGKKLSRKGVVVVERLLSHCLQIVFQPHWVQEHLTCSEGTKVMVLIALQAACSLEITNQFDSGRKHSVIEQMQGMKKGHSGRPRQPILLSLNPILLSRLPSDNQLIIDKNLPEYVHCFCAWCRLSRHNLCILKQYGRGCAACKIVRQATFDMS